MRIIQLIDSLRAGGAERMAVNIANALCDEGHNVLLVATREGGLMLNYLKPYIPHEILLKQSALDFLTFRKFIKVLRRFRPDVIHAHSSSIYWATFAKMVIPELRIIWHDHYGNRTRTTVIERLILKKVTKKVNTIIAVNQELENWAKQYLSVSHACIHQLNNFPYIRGGKGMKVKDKIRILCLANLRNPKGHDIIIESFIQLTKNPIGVDVELVFAGSYNVEESYYKGLINTISESRISNKVIFLGSVDNVELVLSEASIGILGSLSEGLPVSLLEYGLAGLPVVVTDVGQCGAVVDYGNAGWLVPPCNPDALAEALIEIIQNPVEAQIRAKRLHERVTDLYGAKNFMKSYNSLLSDMFG